MRYLLLSINLLFSISLLAQSPTQTVRGKVVDEESKYPLEAVEVALRMADGQVLNTLTESDGTYRIEGVKVGRQAMLFRVGGYQKVVLENIEVTSGKEVILNIEMQSSSVEVETIEITARTNGDAGNEMAITSAREFSPEETNRFAGSRGDPPRMASNYAGVQGADDSRNDIVIRGNTPQGLLYRLDGINIPNPNHFSIPGTGGGPVTILNNKFLTNSDFFTGAFPAEFSNGIAGVFDLKMRNGNNEKHEFSGQLGFLGTELMAEGPLSKESGASYLGMYRYSTLGLFSFLGVDVGTDAVPQYQDGAFRVNLPQKNGANLAIWGVGGLSTIDIVLNTQVAPDTATLIFGSNDRDQYFTSNMGIIAATYQYPINLKTYLKVSFAASHQKVISHHDQIFRRVVDDKFVVDSLPAILDYTFRENKYSGTFFINKKIGLNHTLKAGINADLYQMNYIDSVRLFQTDPPGLHPWQQRWNATSNAWLLQPYVQYKLRVKDRFTMVAGLTSLYWSLNDNSLSPIEPRLAFSYQLSENQKISLGTGLHSQIQSPYIYFYGQPVTDQIPQPHNLGMGLTKSAHAVLGYDWGISKDLRLKAETYYQHLYNIPVSKTPGSFSLINAGSGFARLFPDSLVNEGTGRNFGVELTLEKFFSKNYFFLLTGSLFDAKYKGSDGILRNTTFNGRFAVNALFGKEIQIGKASGLGLGAKATYVGGRWYGPVDTLASAALLEIVYADATVNSQQFRPYFRADAKVSYRWNRPKVTHEIAIDLVNVFDIQNILTLTYAPDHPSGNPIREEYQLGFLPLFYYKIDW